MNPAAFPTAERANEQKRKEATAPIRYLQRPVPRIQHVDHLQTHACVYHSEEPESVRAAPPMAKPFPIAAVVFPQRQGYP